MNDPLDELRARAYLDQDVPVQLEGMLRAFGLDVLTTLEAGNLGLPDVLQLEFAVSSNRAMITHNRVDYENLHLEWLNSAREHGGILIAPQRRDLHTTRDRIMDSSTASTAPRSGMACITFERERSAGSTYRRTAARTTWTIASTSAWATPRRS